jgi:hypothetical protein
MAEFDSKKAQQKQSEFLDRVEGIRRNLKADVVDYYWNRSPQSEDDVRENERGMYKYLKIAHEDIGRLLDALR